MSGGLVALGLIATAAGVRTAFYAFALILLPTLVVVVGVVTFSRVFQCGIEDYGYAIRIARLRAYYFEHSPELVANGSSPSPRWSPSSPRCCSARRSDWWPRSSSTTCSWSRSSPACWAPGATLTALINVQSSTWRREATRMLAES